MTRRRAPSASAASSYAATLTASRAKLGRLAAALEDHAGRAGATPQWGDAGDLAEVNKRLDELLAFLAPGAATETTPPVRPAPLNLAAIDTRDPHATVSYLEATQPYRVRTSCGHEVIRRMRPATAGVAFGPDVVLDAPGGAPCEACRAATRLP